MAHEKIKRACPVTFLLFALTLAGGYLRLHNLGGQSFWLDEAFSVVHAQAILHHGYPLLSTGQASWTYFPVHYLMAAGLAGHADLHTGARMASALAGTLLIPVFFWFNWRLTGSRPQALLAALLLAFLTYEIAWSRQARGYVILQLAGFATLGCLLDYTQTRRRWMQAAGFAGAVLCPVIHPAGAWYTLVAGAWAWPHLGRTGRLAMGGIGAALLAGSLPRVADRFLGHEASNYGLLYARFLYQELGPFLVWSGAGLILGLGPLRKRTGRLAVATLAFLGLIAFQTSLFHYRYVLPVLPLLLTFGTAGAEFLWRQLWSGRTLGARGLALLTAGLCVVSLTGMNLNVRPYQTYYLGPTEPQPEWATAYRWVEQDAVRRGLAPDQIHTISTFPVFHELYLGTGGARSYLSLSLTGDTNEIWTSASYSRAHTVDSLEAFSRLQGYVILDHMGFELLADASIRQALARMKPALVVPGPVAIVIWRLEPRVPQLDLLKNLRAGHPQRVVVYGTSLTAEGAWVDQVRLTLGASFPGLLTLINTAVPGWWSGPALDRLEERVLRHAPDAVFLEFTVNDAYLEAGTTVEEARFNLNEMINRILEHNPRCDITLLVMNPVWGKQQTLRPELERYETMYREVARKRGCRLLDISVAWQNLLARHPQALTELIPDGVHPSPEGHRQVTAPQIHRLLISDTP